MRKFGDQIALGFCVLLCLAAAPASSLEPCMGVYVGQLRDAHERVVGQIEQQSSHVFIARMASGRRVGSFDTQSNITRTANGQIVGRGDWLAALIGQEAR